MILSPLTHSSAYASLSPLFAAAFRFCHTTDLLSAPLGRHDIPGTPPGDLFALLQEYTLKPESDCRYEAHRTYADIQLVLSGTEAISIVPLESCELDGVFDAAKDLGFYRCSGTGAHRLTVPPGCFAVFFPHDAHMPLIAPASYTGALVRKVVLKVRVA